MALARRLGALIFMAFCGLTAISPSVAVAAGDPAFSIVGVAVDVTAGDAATAISQVTIADPGGLITAANDIRIMIPGGFNMVWDSSDTLASISGTGSSKVDSAVTYEAGDKTLRIDVTTDFAGGDSITVSGLQPAKAATWARSGPALPP